MHVRVCSMCSSKCVHVRVAVVSSFVSPPTTRSVCHRLRNPLHAMQATLGFLSADKDLQEDQKGDVEVCRQRRRLLRAPPLSPDS